jgi:hypothetical protein
MNEDVRGLEVRGSPTRCPYCHNDVSPEETVACQSCLARHHAECWNSHGTCATCGSARRLEAPPKETRRLTPAVARNALLTAGFEHKEIDAVLAGDADQARAERMREQNRAFAKALIVLAFSAGGGMLAGALAFNEFTDAYGRNTIAPLVGFGVGLLMLSVSGALSLLFGRRPR